MKKFFLLLVALIGVHASDAISSVLVKATDGKSSFSALFDPASGQQGSFRDGSIIGETSVYSISNGFLFHDVAQCAEAHQLLAQASVGSVEIAVFRTEHYSVLTHPLSALAGHPVPVTRIYVIAFENGRLAWKRQIGKADSWNGWKASIENEHE